MKFSFVDRIVELQVPERIVTIKAVTLSEEYLADHFPTFPVLPGVLMLQSLAEAGMWLVRKAQDFSHSMILLKEARNVTYKSFVKPGNLLTGEVTCRRLAHDTSEFVGVGRSGDREVVKARFVLRHFNLAKDGDSALSALDSRLIRQARDTFSLLFRDELTELGRQADLKNSFELEAVQEAL